MKYHLTLLLLSLTVCAYAQNCTQRLNQAEDDYEAGKLLGIPKQIKACLENKSFTKEEEVRARKLLTLVYIFTDQEAFAERAIINLLKAEPEHRLDPLVDPQELYYLYEQYRTKPIFRLSFKVGMNISNVVLIEEFATHNTLVHDNFYNGTTNSGAGSYEVDTLSGYNAISTRDYSIWGEVLAQKEVSEGVDVLAGFQYRTSSYAADTYINQLNLNSSATNSQTYLRLPVGVSYTHWSDNRDRKLLPYVFVGGSFDYLLSATGSISRSGGTASSVAEVDLIATNQVNRFNYSFTGGLGLKIRFKTHFFFVEGRYDTSRMNYINGEERYTNLDYTFDGAYVEPALSLDFLSVSGGFNWSIYKPKKL